MFAAGVAREGLVRRQDDERAGRGSETALQNGSGNDEIGHASPYPRRRENGNRISEHVMISSEGRGGGRGDRMSNAGKRPSSPDFLNLPQESLVEAAIDSDDLAGGLAQAVADEEEVGFGLVSGGDGRLW